MAASVRGLSLASTSQADASTSHSSSFRASRRLSSSSSSRGVNIYINAKGAKRASRSSSHVLFAVLVDKHVKSRPSLELAKSETVDSLVQRPDLLDSVVLDSVLRALADDEDPKAGLTKQMGQTDTNLKSSLEHRLWVAFGASAVTAMVAKGVFACNSNGDAFQVGAGILAAWILSDLATGFYHWGVDNYGSATTPIFGSQIDAFQGHHQRPWTITKREFANNIQAIARPAGLFLTPFLLLPSHPFFDSFLAVFLGLVVMSQQLHAMAHKKKSQLPEYILALQDRGVILGRKMHGMHHRPPYDVNYCIISGLWNPWLNEAMVFKKMERWIYRQWGVAPRAWSETSEEWLQADTYFEDGTEFDPSQNSSESSEWERGMLGLFERTGRTEIVPAEPRSEVSSIGDLDIYH